MVKAEIINQQTEPVSTPEGAQASSAKKLAETVAPWLSVIVPTYNGAAYLPRALDSIANQTGPDIEVIAIDDGSTDDTVKVLESYQTRLNLKVVSRGRVGNWVSNTNYALSLARGEYACFLHQDDFWLPGRISQMRKLAQGQPNAVVILHPSQFVDAEGKITGNWNCPFPKRAGLLDSDYVFRRLIVQNFIAIPSPIFKREAACSAGLLDESLWYTADWKFWLALAKLGPWAYLPEPLAAFRIHLGSQTATGAARSQAAQLKSVLKSALPAIGADDSLRRVARYSVHVNQSLAHCFFRGKYPPTRLLLRGVRLGPVDFVRYLRYSRILERVSARFSATLFDRRAPGRNVV